MMRLFLFTPAGQGRFWRYAFCFPAFFCGLSVLTGTALAAGDVSDGDVIFDSQYLQARGVNPKVAEWFRQAPRFPPGESLVTLSVNGQPRGKIRVRFDEKGHPCINAAFLRQAGIITNILPADTSGGNTSCVDLNAHWPQTELTADPAQGSISLVVPAEAIDNTRATNTRWSHGGVAGLLNYNAQYMGASGEMQGTTYMQLGTEAGFNAGDWIARSRQTFSRFNGEDRVQHQGAYLQRSFVSQQKVLQAGQISLANSLFGTGQVLGVQLFPEQALLSQGNSGALVEGIADTQSVAEVRQSGVLVYSTTVPAGPFRLQGFPLLNTRSDLTVILTGADGNKRQFSVPASIYLLSGPAAPQGLSLGMGRLEQSGSTGSPWVATAASGWQPSARVGISAGGLTSSPYQAVAGGIDVQPYGGTLLSGRLTAARDTRHQQQGISFTATLSHMLTEQFSFNVSTAQQTPGYRELSDALQPDAQDVRGQTRSQYGAGMGWSAPWVGGLSFSWAQNTSFQGQSSQYLRAAWSRQFGRAFVGASMDRDFNGYLGAENRFYLTLSLPFGNSASLNSWINSARNTHRSGIRYSDRLSQDRSWSLSAEQESRTNRQSATGTLNSVTPVGQLSSSLTRDSDRYTSWSSSVSGGVAFHRHGATLSPYQIGDTFGVARVGSEKGVRVETPAGPAWTDYRGYAVLPSLGAYRRSRIELDTRSLNRSTDVANAWQETETARGAISYVDFDVIRTRRVQVAVTDGQGGKLPAGAGVFDEKEQFITVTASDGTLFVPDARPGMVLSVEMTGRSACTITLGLPEKAAGNELFETTQAVCHQSKDKL